MAGWWVQPSVDKEKMLAAGSKTFSHLPTRLG